RGCEPPHPDRSGAAGITEEHGSTESRTSGGDSRRRSRRLQKHRRSAEHLHRSRDNQRGVRHRKMNITRGAASLFGLAMLLWTASIAIPQSEPEVRRARPVDEPPVRRAVPADESIDKVLRSLKDDVSE